jgi:PAS domain S-box-containing protein
MRRFLRTLTGKTLLRLAVAGSVLLAAAAALNSYLVYRQSEREASLRLAAAAAERARVAERVLGYTIETHEIVRLAFVDKWPSYRNAVTARRLEAILARYPDGVWRNRQEFSDGRIHPTGWVPKSTALTDDLRCMLVLFWDLSRYYGPGAAIRKDNLFFMSVPEETNLGYDPYLFPNWVFDIPADFTQFDYEWGRLAYEPARPGDRPRFSTPYVDDVGPGPELGPLFHVLTAVHVDDRHVATIATTLMLREFLARALPDVPRDHRYLLFHANGRLFADTSRQAYEMPAVEQATLQQFGGDLPGALQEATAAAGPSPRSGYSSQSDAYYAIARIDGPPWYVASTLPGAMVRADALRVALWSSAAHLGVLAVLLALLAVILRRQVAAPLGELTRAAGSVARGDTGVRLPSGRDDELGQLAAAFNDMAVRVAERDAALRHDKEQIEAALTSLRLTEERWRAMTDNASDFIAVVDDGGTITYVSPPVRKALGYGVQELLGRPLAGFVHADDVETLRSRLRQPGPAAIEFRARHATGEWRVLEAAGSDMRGHAAVGGIVLNIRDVTETVKAEKQLRQAQKLEAIGTLAGGIAHDFNNILGAILGYGEMAQKEAPEGSAQRRHIDAAMSAGLRAKSLVERILAFSRSGMGERVPVHVQAVVEEALDVVAAGLPPGVRIERRLEAGDAAVTGDPTQVHQVVMNLCANAVQAMKAGGTLTVSLDLVEATDALHARRPPTDGRNVRLRVRDTGTGIAPAVLERIFDPFFTTKEVGVGTGLGLSLVHGIVTDLGGRIDVASQVGEGTTFTVTLPSRGTAPAPARVQESVPRGAGETVLLVDDEEPLVRLGEEMIAGLGYEPVGFTSSTAALAAFRAAPQRFHAVLSDEAMPERTGSELAREILRIRPDIPIVLMTGFVGPALTERAVEVGVREVLAKPLLARDVARCLAGALGR